MYAYPSLPSQTEKGIRSLSQTIIVFMAVQVLLVVLLVSVLPLLFGALIDPGNPSIIAAAITLLAVACVLLVVIFVGLILGLIGLLALHKGRDEFGPAHAQKIDHGIIVLIIGIVLPGIIGGIGGAGAGGFAGLSVQIDIVSAAADLVAGVLGALLVGLFLLWSVEALATPEIRQRGMFALVLGVISAISSGATSIVVLYTVPLPTDPADLTLSRLFPFLLPAFVSAALSIVSLALWYMMYRAVLDRFKRGELRAAPPAIMYPPPYPPPYYPYQQPYAPQAPPQAPPPQEPPPANPPPNP